MNKHVDQSETIACYNCHHMMTPMYQEDDTYQCPLCEVPLPVIPSTIVHQWHDRNFESIAKDTDTNPATLAAQMNFCENFESCQMILAPGNTNNLCPKCQRQRSIIGDGIH